VFISTANFTNYVLELIRKWINYLINAHLCLFEIEYFTRNHYIFLYIHWNSWLAIGIWIIESDSSATAYILYSYYIKHYYIIWVNGLIRRNLSLYFHLAVSNTLHLIDPDRKTRIFLYHDTRTTIIVYECVVNIVTGLILSAVSVWPKGRSSYLLNDKL